MIRSVALLAIGSLAISACGSDAQQERNRVAIDDQMNMIQAPTHETMWHPDAADQGNQAGAAPSRQR
ncbi:hypothetical protein Q4F19_14425 [Sphingomonas sp. BIUV-7]|uniref:Lipoprotein n=1 Tax=Sphingomonas natans TaxID=3063330 RepID=A0ABT8YB70_9SPHN|nr:hypothetical protein [Sphingomonas sp. BIUV-7]MDO6415582.1 hypothetical protein [Sphingomonas sp. BIUV-7]